jgi:hypothetical protein
MKRSLIILLASALSLQYCLAYDARNEAAQKVRLYYSLLQQYARNQSRTELYDRIAELFIDGQGSVCNDIYSKVYGYPAANSDIRNYITAAGAYKNRSGGYPLDIRIDSESFRFDEKGSDGIYVSVMKYVSCRGGKIPAEYNFREVLLIRNDKIVCIFPEKEKPQEHVDTDIYISPVKEGWISGVRMFSTINEILIRTDFNINGMEGKNAEVSCYFYDGNGYRLRDRNSTYCTSDGQVATGTEIKPPYSHTKYTDLEIRIPKSELHLNGRRLDVIQVVVVIWDKSQPRAEEICKSSVIKFCYDLR